ncbi:MAG TPA: metal ABC transporter substrate-binding protein [Solirubrobacteraceae bacterium]|nr:metal ABC transporter substrate-binding protein [Solirubrobacteraceae bacterium]
MFRAAAAPAPLLVTVALALAACGADGPSGSAAQEGGVRVVATTTHVADLARAVGGDRARVDSLLTPGSDPHDYEPRPSDARALADADLVLRSGGDIDEWLTGLVESVGTGASTLSLMESVRTIDGDDEDTGLDPHWWQDPTNAIAAVAQIRDVLVVADPEGRETYQANAEAYLSELRALDEAISGCMRSIPAADRKLVTTHDALGYFADRYEIEVVGLVVPALTTRAQASAGEVAQLTQAIEDEGVETVFPESQLPAGLEQAIAKEAGAQVGPGLWTDSLGPPGSGAATYIEAMRFNAQAIADGFGGDCSI